MVCYSLSYGWTSDVAEFNLEGRAVGLVMSAGGTIYPVAGPLFRTDPSIESAHSFWRLDHSPNSTSRTCAGMTGPLHGTCSQCLERYSPSAVYESAYMSLSPARTAVPLSVSLLPRRVPLHTFEQELMKLLY